VAFIYATRKLLAELHTLTPLPCVWCSHPCRFLLEGQEEIGSPNLPNFLDSHSEGLLAGVDLVLNADGGQVSATQPGICTGRCLPVTSELSSYNGALFKNALLATAHAPVDMAHCMQPTNHFSLADGVAECCIQISQH